MNNYYSYSDLMAEIDYFRKKKDITKLRLLLEKCNDLSCMMNENLKTAIKNKTNEIEGRKQLDYACDFLKLKEAIRELERIELYFDEL